ncbi:MAG: DUF58 domain-containing protein [Anaerolineae bacterium]|nr:DUF58 domain-containing protein [Anaerolineae bacterium]
MPTARFYSFAIGALILYLFANQTQVGWLYVMSAVLFGLLIVSWILNRGAVSGITLERRIEPTDLYEDEASTVEITLRLAGRMPSVQLNVWENCPIAPPEEREKHLFIPILNEKISFTYTVINDRRGVHTFTPIKVSSRAPFGYFQRQKRLDSPTRILIYPVVKPLTRLSLLDRQLAAEQVFPRPGLGSEIIGTRPYRAGDSPRHIHWRSVARTGNLISKEFAQETEPGVTLIFDRWYPHPNDQKQTPFEWAIKCTMSIAEYAYRNRYPLYLAADQQDLATPNGALAWEALLQYMARVAPTAHPHLEQLLASNQGFQNFIVVITAQADHTLIEAAARLQHRGYTLMVVLIDGATFPVGGKLPDGIAHGLEEAGILTRVIRFGQDWVERLVYDV